jgi:hypothetical protein
MTRYAAHDPVRRRRRGDWLFADGRMAPVSCGGCLAAGGGRRGKLARLQRLAIGRQICPGDAGRVAHQEFAERAVADDVHVPAGVKSLTRQVCLSRRMPRKQIPGGDCSRLGRCACANVRRYHFSRCLEYCALNDARFDSDQYKDLP